MGVWLRLISRMKSVHSFARSPKKRGIQGEDESVASPLFVAIACLNRRGARPATAAQGNPCSLLSELQERQGHRFDAVQAGT